jgi:uncharacterized protein
MHLHTAAAHAGHAGVSRGAYPFPPQTLARSASPFSRCSILLAPGFQGALALDWRHRLPQFSTVRQSEWEIPDLDIWAQSILKAARRLPQPVVVVAQGFACLATVRAATLQPGVIAGALLTAPSDPVRLGLQERLADLTLDLPSVLVCNEGDQELPPERAWQWALHWNSQFASLGQGAVRSGHAGWQRKPDLGFDLLEQLCRRVAAPAEAA